MSEKKLFQDIDEYLDEQFSIRTVDYSDEYADKILSDRDAKVMRLYEGAKVRHYRRWPGEKMASMSELYPLPSCCPILGIDIYYPSTSRGKSSPSIDRVDNRFGYVPGNIRIVSWEGNRIKRALTIDQINALAKYVSG